MASETATSALTAISDLQKKTAQAIVNIFETGRVQGEYGRVTLLAGDSGHLTYGRSQTTLASGNLFLLLKSYCEASNARVADGLRPYLSRASDRDLTLDNDWTFRRILQDAGDDPVMHETQDQFFDRIYWTPAVQSARNVGLLTGLGTAVAYDSLVHGSWGLMREKTHASGTVAQIGEKKWVSNYVSVRRNWLATHTNTLLHKCVYRMDSFTQIIQQERWHLELPLSVRGIPLTVDLLMAPPVRVSAETETRRVLKLLEPYMVGDDVRALQLALASRDPGVTIDGIYGPLTEAHVRQFQQQNGMKADGMVGPATRAALGVD